MATEKRPKKLWYVIAVDPGTDKRVRREIQRSCKIRDCKDIGRVIIKHHIEDRFRDGKWVPCRVKSFPGYLIINMRYTNESFHIIESLRRFGVFGFLNLKPTLGGLRYPRKEKAQRTPPKPWEIELRETWIPTPVESVEVAFLMLDEKQVDAKKAKIRRERELADARNAPVDEPVVKKILPDTPVKIIDGVFAGTTGIVRRAVDSQDSQTLTVEVTLMGKVTKLGISSNQVERV